MLKYLKGLMCFFVITLAGCTSAPATSVPTHEPFVVYHRSGGLGGFDETWSMYADGRIEHSGRGAGSAGQLTPDRVNRLIAAIRSIDLTSIKESYVGSNTCCDRFIYEITINLDGKIKSIETIDAAEGEPAGVSQLLSAITLAVNQQ